MKQTILTVVLIVLLLAIGFVWYNYLRPPAEGGPAASVDTVIDAARLEQYRGLKQLRLDVSIFSDPLFRLLEEQTPSMGTAAVQAGRANPFAPF